MFKLMILASFGYAVLAIFMVLSRDYMDAFVALTITLIFIFGLSDVFNNKKSGTAHAITGSIIGLIFEIYYVTALLAAAFDSLINNGAFEFKPLSNFFIATVLFIFNLYLFFHLKVEFKNKK
ncbi:MAG: hypothetical protein M1542_09070 [Thermotogae bacterium]|nr:hypothetical protein [Thermotogota bacterium]